MVEVTATRDLSRLRGVVQSRFLFYADCQEWQQKQKANETGLAGLVELQGGDTLIIPDVTSGKGQVMLDRSGGNEDVKVTNGSCLSVSVRL
jgi:hypothetical protein